MTNHPNSPNGRPAQAKILQDVRRGLQRELEMRRSEKTAAMAGSSDCTSPPSPAMLRTSSSPSSSLCDILANILRCKSSSARNANGMIIGGSFSPSQSGASSDNSISGGASGNFCSVNSRPIFGRGSSGNYSATRVLAQARAIGQPERVELNPNSAMMPSSSAPSAGLGRGRAGALASAATAIGGPKAKVHKKRKRPSKKPPTTIIEVTPEEFCAKVRELTDCKELPIPVVPPQRESPQAELQEELNDAAVPIDVDVDENSRNRPADSPPTSMMTAVSSPSPTVSDRVPEARLSILDSSSAADSSSSLKSSRMNYCMGYHQTAPPEFIEEQQLDYDENLGQLPVHNSGYGFSVSSQSMRNSNKRHEVRPSTSAATPTRAIQVQEAAEPLPSESNSKKEVPVPRASASGSSMPDHIMRPSRFFVPMNRPKEVEVFEMELMDESGTWSDNIDEADCWLQLDYDG
ncbi:unnamed protein product [Calypogeia fissa]